MSWPTPNRRWMYAPLAFGFVGSSCTHGSVILALLFGATGSGGAGGGGEDGQGGAGDTTIDISVAGSPDQPASTATAVAPPAPPAPTSPPSTEHETQEIHEDENAEDKTLPKPSAVAHAEPAAPQPTLPPLPQSVGARGSADTTASGRLRGPTHIGFPGEGAGSGVDGSSVDGQRALLPAAIKCADPVAGRWEALKFNPRMGAWVRFSLVVRHYENGVVGGTIISHTWSGGVLDRVPPGCSPGAFDITVAMNASGVTTGSGRITFGASHYSVVAERCPSFGTDYAPDNFSGTIDDSRQEFQSLNNDGANDVNAPYVFRRTGCL